MYNQPTWFAAHYYATGMVLWTIAYPFGKKIRDFGQKNGTTWLYMYNQPMSWPVRRNRLRPPNWADNNSVLI
jgi:hypothetical protein